MTKKSKSNNKGLIATILVVGLVITFTTMASFYGDKKISSIVDLIKPEAKPEGILINENCGFWVPDLGSIPSGDKITQYRTCFNTYKKEMGQTYTLEVSTTRPAIGVKFIAGRR